MSSLKTFRRIALAEGASFLVLLFVAMPLKYLAGMPLAVKLVGWAHGVLFVAWLWALQNVSTDRDWPMTRRILALVSGVVPFGAFVFDRSLRDEEGRAADPAVDG